MSANISVIQPTGILDSTNGNGLRDAINDKLHAGHRSILIDFRDVTFMDSTGLAALVIALKAVRTTGGKLYVCSINDQVRMLFELTSMDQVFEIFPSRSAFDQALLARA